MSFSLAPLPYAYNALEPHFDALTMEIHHSRHHQAYVTNLNAAIAGTELENSPLLEMFAHISKLPPAVRNNGGGHYNHDMFWHSLSPTGGGNPMGNVAAKIAEKWESFDAFKAEFKKAALTRFGSGWAWLCAKNGGLDICSTANQDNPLMDIAGTCGGTPILGLDVWEHAYYLKFQNKRPDYIDSFWNIVDWNVVEARFLATK